MPIGLAVAGANRHDMKLVRLTLESIVVEHPAPTPAEPLRAGDVIVAVGTREGLDGVARLLSTGPG